MNRVVEEMGAPKRLNEMLAPFKALDRFAEIKLPSDAEEPILAPTIRAAVFEWLTEIRHSKALDAVGIKPRRSALLYGPPGTGKTTLAHHLAARLGVPLVAVQSEQLVNNSLGGSGRNVAALFTALNAVDGKCVVLLDEIDSIGSRRSNDDEACAREMNAVLNTLLRYVEGFQGICVAATNRQDALDPALWRRFGIQMSVDLPGIDERFAIIRRYAVPFDPGDDDVDLLADVTHGASPALLRQLMEGVKRSITIGPKINRDVSNPITVFASVISSVAMPPEFEAPPLWADQKSVRSLAGLSWPWTLMEAK